MNGLYIKVQNGKAQKVKYTGEAPSIEGLTNIFDAKAKKLPSKLKPGEYQVWAK